MNLSRFLVLTTLHKFLSRKKAIRLNSNSKTFFLPDVTFLTSAKVAKLFANATNTLNVPDSTSWTSVSTARTTPWDRSASSVNHSL
jgi:hypothetical protein